MWYKYSELARFLIEQGCEFEGDRIPHGQGWFGRDQCPFTLPDPDPHGYILKEIVDMILSDRWICPVESLARLEALTDEQLMADRRKVDSPPGQPEGFFRFPNIDRRTR